MNYDLSIVVTITVTCYSWAPSSGDHLFYMWRHLQAATLTKHVIPPFVINRIAQ